MHSDPTVALLERAVLCGVGRGRAMSSECFLARPNCSRPCSFVNRPFPSPRRVPRTDKEEQSAWPGTGHADLSVARQRLVSDRTSSVACRSLPRYPVVALVWVWVLHTPVCVRGKGGEGGKEGKGREGLAHVSLLRCRDEFTYEDQALTDSAELKIDQVRADL